MEYLAEFGLKIKHIPGDGNIVVDAMSEQN